MKRSISTENTDTTDKKSKSGEEQTDGDGSSVSQTPTPMESGFGDVSVRPGSTPVLVEEKDITARSSDTPLSTVGSVADSEAPSTSDNAQDKPEDNKESEAMEIKDEDKDQKSERWQLIPTTVRQRMNYIMSTDKLSDCTLLIGSPDNQKEFKLHSVILCMSSPEFEDMLNENKELIIPDVEPDIFKQVLEYVYLDYVNLWSVEKTQALYRASVKFKLPHLCEKAVEYMMAKMSLDSIWPIFDAAIATQDQILTDECSKYFKKQINDILKHPKFPTVDPTVISDIVSDDNLGVVEADLVSGVLKWAHQKCLDNDLVPNLENKRKFLPQKTIGKLRFLALTKEYFATNVAFSKSKGDESILTMEESYAILMNMVQPNSYPMPEGFSTVEKPRTVVTLERLVRRIFNPLGNYQPLSSQSPRLDKLTVLPGPSLTAPFGCKNFSLDLVVNQAITLYGIQVPTFFPGMIGATPKLYEETYIVSIQNTSKPNKPMLGSINWSGKVAYNSFVDLPFKETVRLEKNNTYTLIVYTNNTYYLNQKLCTVEELKSVKFTFKDSVALFGKPGKQDFAFISQILFSL